jgi:phospholipid/cholesterol/gamma-HCH transport system permease protein
MKTWNVGRIGSNIQRKGRDLLDFYFFSVSVIYRMFRFHQLKDIGKTVLLRQILFTGFDALLLIGFIALSISALVVLEVRQFMGQLGKGRLIFELMVVIVTRQLSSLLVTLVVIARSGTAIATELGNMVVHKEIELLNSFGLSPFTYLVVPRVTGVFVSIFILTIYFNFIAVVGGAIFYYAFYNVNIIYFIDRFMRELTFNDLFMPVIKSLLFGFSVGLISCYLGLKVERASTEVPRQTMYSVVYCVMAVIVLNIAVTLVNYL